MNADRERYLTTALREALEREHELATELRRREEFGLDERDDPPPPWLNDPPEIAPQAGQPFRVFDGLYLVREVHTEIRVSQPERITVEFVAFEMFLEHQRQALKAITGFFGAQHQAAKEAAKAMDAFAAALKTGRLWHQP